MRTGLFVATLDETPPATSPVYTESERRYCLSRRDPGPHLAGRYAAKRAACIALGLDEESARGSLSEVEVAREPGRAPTLHFLGTAKPLVAANARGYVSISHSGNFAVAFVVIE